MCSDLERIVFKDRELGRQTGGSALVGMGEIALNATYKFGGDGLFSLNDGSPHELTAVYNQFLSCEIAAVR
jgi:hypothetical protein